MSVYESQDDQGQHEEVYVMSPNFFTTIDLNVTLASDPISVAINEDE